jgi:hypothetical protein
MHKLKNSETHNVCEKAQCKSKAEVLQDANLWVISKYEEKTARVFKTAFNTVKKGEAVQRHDP